MIAKIKLNTQETDEISEYVYQITSKTTQPGLTTLNCSDNGWVGIDTSTDESKKHPEIYRQNEDEEFVWDGYLGDTPDMKGEIYIEKVELFTDNMVLIQDWNC